MGKPFSAVLAVAFVASWAVSSFQGQRVDQLHEAEQFYRWIIGASNQVRVFGHVVDPIELEYSPNAKDEELFADVAEAMDGLLTNVPEISESDLDAAGEPLPKIVRMAAPPTEDRGGTDETDAGAAARADAADEAEQAARDQEIWRLAKGPELAELRQQFHKYLRDGQLVSVGTQLDTSIVIDPSVSTANLFFGFRKMAASLVWLEVQDAWDNGYTWKIVPLMRTTVILDPQFVDAYLLGAWHMAYNITAQMPDTPTAQKEYIPRFEERLGPKESYYYEAIEFLKDGIRKNPRDYRLYFDLGFSIYEGKLSDKENAIYFLKEAIKHKHDMWVPRQLYRLMYEAGHLEESLQGWNRYLLRDPNNQFAPVAILRVQGLMLERDMREAVERAETAEAAGDTAAAEAARAEAQALRQEVIDHWQLMYDQSKADEIPDNYAWSRLQTLEAEELIKENRPYEALVYIEQARWENPQYFDQFSDRMIEVKQQFGIPLNLSERMALERRAEEASYERSIGDGMYLFSKGTWFEKGYRDQPLTEVRPDSPAVADLRSSDETVNEILGLLEIRGEAIVFETGGTWYRYQA